MSKRNPYFEVGILSRLAVRPDGCLGLFLKTPHPINVVCHVCSISSYTTTMAFVRRRGYVHRGISILYYNLFITVEIIHGVDLLYI